MRGKSLNQKLPILNRALRLLLPLALLAPALAASDATGPASMAPHAGRHALIIGIGSYQDARVTTLRGVKHDMVSARKMAEAMRVPEGNITVVTDAEATDAGIRAAFDALNKRVKEGDRVFIYYSGHGTRRLDPRYASEGCTEALLTHDSRAVSNRDVADLLSPIAAKTDKLMVMYDACHSGGIASQPLRTRSVAPVDGLELQPKFDARAVDAACAKPANIRTRSLTSASTQKGGLPENIVHISSARSDEVSFDEAAGGGIATQAWRDCLLRDARDLDASGAISVEEIRACAQARIDARLKGKADLSAHHLTLGGNPNFVPAHFVREAEASTATTTTSASTSVDKLFTDVLGQADARLKVLAKPGAAKVRIGKDALAFSVAANRPGYVYVLVAGTKGDDYTLLFPNDLDADNKIAAGQTFTLPRPSWRLMSQGPAGRNEFLVIVADAPRNFQQIPTSPNGPFIRTLNDPLGRVNLQWLLATASGVGTPACSQPAADPALCSDRFGATRFTVEEIQ